MEWNMPSKVGHVKEGGLVKSGGVDHLRCWKNASIVGQLNGSSKSILRMG